MHGSILKRSMWVMYLFPILYIWGIGILAVGQSSTITGTYAWQFIVGGFLNLRLKKWIGYEGIHHTKLFNSCSYVRYIRGHIGCFELMANVLQSIQIPFVLIPLLFLVSSERIMRSFMIGNALKHK